MLTEHHTMTPTRSNREPSHHRRHRPFCACFSLGGVLALTMILLTGAAIAPRTAQAGDITYSLANYTSDQAGHSVSGSITTDGTIGTLAPSDILSWTVTIDSTTFTSNDAGAIALASGQLTASATSITLPASDSSTPNGLEFSTNSPENAIQWIRVGVAPDNQYEAGIAGSPLWSTNNPAMGGTDPWVIASISTASVPEPSSAVLAMFGAATIVGYEVFRRRGQRRQASAWQPHPAE